MFIAEMKSKVNMREYVQQAGLNPVHHQPAYDTYLCVFHPESSGSLQIYADHGHCHGCNWHGDVVDFVKDQTPGMSTAEAARVVASKANFHVDMPQPVKKRRKDEDFTYLVNRATANQDLAIQYLENRGVDGKLAISYWCGADPNISWKYHFQEGGTVKHSCRRYAFPNIFRGKVRNIEYRLDDDFARMELGRLSHDDIEAVRVDFMKRRDGEIPEESDLVERIFGPKYKRTGQTHFIYNLSALIDDHGQIRKGHSVMLVSAENKAIDVLTLLTHGFTAVGLPQKLTQDYRPAFKAVPVIYIIGDNGGEGPEKAQKARDHLGRGSVIFPPKGFKDINDVARAGKLPKWLASLGITPAAQH